MAENQNGSKYFNPPSDDEDENQNLIQKQQNDIEKQQQSSKTQYLKKKYMQYANGEEGENPNYFERFCILFVFIGLLIVLFVICTILISTFKVQEFQKQQELLMKQPMIKPITDKKEYKTMILRNQLKVLLVSDPESSLSYASMDVNAGSWVEPREIPGLAHYLEHMLFLASKTYNKTAYFDDFLAQNGGYSNAYTTDLHTNFFFHINTKAFEDGLSIFSHMFIDPLFVRDQANKEAHNVESEYQIDVNEDSWMLQNLVTLLCRKEHPMSGFTIGTVRTLIENTQRQGIDVVDSLQQFFDKNYSANLMSLVLYSGESIETMENYIQSAQFSQIKNKNLKAPDMGPYGLPIDPTNQNSIFKVQTNSGQKTLNMVYQLEGEMVERKRAIEYLFQMINYYGQGSFLDQMKSTGMLVDLSFDILHKDPQFAVLEFQFTLTDIGFEAPGLLINTFYTYLNKIKDEGLSQILYDDMKVQAENEFEYQLSGQSDLFEEKISQLSSYLNQYSPPEILKQDFTFEDFDETYIRGTLEQILDLKSCIFILGSNQFFASNQQDGENQDQIELLQVQQEEDQEEQENQDQEQYDETFRFIESDPIGKFQEFLLDNQNFEYNQLYNLKYFKMQLDDDTINQLTDQNEVLYVSLQLPKKNSYIPENKDLINVCENKDDENLKEFIGSSYVVDLEKELNQQRENSEFDDLEDVLNEQGINQVMSDQKGKFMGDISDDFSFVDSFSIIDDLFSGGGDSSDNKDGEQQDVSPFKIYTQDYFKKFVYTPFEFYNETQDVCEDKYEEYIVQNAYPQLVSENSFYMMDTDYNIPMVSLMIQISVVNDVDSDYVIDLTKVENQLKLKVLGEILQVSLMRELAEPINVDYNIEIQTLSTGYTILLEGWSDKFDRYVDLFLESFQKLDIKKEQFEWANDIISTNYMTFQELDPIHQAFQISLHELLIIPSFHYTKYLDASEKLQLSDMQEFFNLLKMNLSVKIMTMGNILPPYALKINEKITKYFLQQKQFYSELLTQGLQNSQNSPSILQEASGSFIQTKDLVGDADIEEEEQNKTKQPKNNNKKGQQQQKNPQQDKQQQPQKQKSKTPQPQSQEQYQEQQKQKQQQKQQQQKGRQTQEQQHKQDKQQENQQEQKQPQKQKDQQPNKQQQQPNKQNQQTKNEQQQQKNKNQSPEQVIEEITSDLSSNSDVIDNIENVGSFGKSQDTQNTTIQQQTEQITVEEEEEEEQTQQQIEEAEILEEEEFEIEYEYEIIEEIIYVEEEEEEILTEEIIVEEEIILVEEQEEVIEVEEEVIEVETEVEEEYEILIEEEVEIVEEEEVLIEEEVVVEEENFENIYSELETLDNVDVNTDTVEIGEEEEEEFIFIVEEEEEEEFYNDDDGQIEELSSDIYNIQQEDTEDQPDKLNKFLFAAPQEKIYNLKGSKNYALRQYLEGNEDNLNSATVNYYQYGVRTLDSFAKMHLLVDILHSHVYNYLRTERELGYVAFCMMVTHSCVDGYVIVVEGSKAAPDVVDEMIEQSLYSFSSKLESLTDEEFQTIKDSAIQTLSQRPQNQNAQIKQYFEKIVSENYVFDENQMIINQLEHVKKESLKQIFEYIFKNNVGKISVQRYSNATELDLQIPDTPLDQLKSFSQQEQVLVKNIKDFEQTAENNLFHCTLTN